MGDVKRLRLYRELCTSAPSLCILSALRSWCEALRDDDNFAHVAAWEWGGESGNAIRHKEELTFDEVALTQRSYK